MTAFLPYVFDIFKLKTKPHAFTWLIWALTQGTATYAIFYGGGGIGGLELLIGTILIALVFLFSLKYGTKDITKTDGLILFVCLLSILVWWQLKQPVLSVIMVSAIDVAGYIPTFRKSYKNPWSETVATWLLFVVSDFFAILALNKYNFLTVTYLATILITNASLFLLCISRRISKNRIKSP